MYLSTKYHAQSENLGTKYIIIQTGFQILKYLKIACENGYIVVKLDNNL